MFAFILLLPEEATVLSCVLWRNQSSFLLKLNEVS